MSENNDNSTNEAPKSPEAPMPPVQPLPPTSQPQNAQPFPPQPSGQPAAPYGPTLENPGQTTGIIGLVLNSLGINVGGIILGAISRSKSKVANQSTALGTISLVWGIASTVIVFLFAALLMIAFSL